MQRTRLFVSTTKVNEILKKIEVEFLYVLFLFFKVQMCILKK